jgi:hypothetical protein
MMQRRTIAAVGLGVGAAAAIAKRATGAPGLKANIQNLNFTAQRVAGRAVDRLAARAGIATGDDYPIPRSSGDRMVEALRAAGFRTTGQTDHEQWQAIRDHRPGVAEVEA